MKGKSTAAFGMALRGWNQGWSIGVYQFVKSAKWRVGEEAAFRALGRLHEETGEGGAVAWHKMGEGWSWITRGDPEDHAANAVRAGPRSSATSPPNATACTSSTSSPTR
jgi:cob(I)alamin adenosyltransferase